MSAKIKCSELCGTACFHRKARDNAAMTVVSTEDRPAWYSQPCFLGIDEAGRGPVLGAMVYACAFAPIVYKDQLAKQAYADSKTLSEDRRKTLFQDIELDTQISFVYDTLTAADISVNMLSRDKISLNTLANESTFKLLDTVVQQGLNLQEVFVDTVGDAAKWQSRLEGKYPGIRFVVCPKADAIYPIVSAASIVAKVVRDSMLRDFKLAEVGLTREQDYGSGYPGDPVTIAWLKSNICEVFGYPQLVRFSWQTTTRLLEGAAHGVQWVHDAEDPGQSTLSFAKVTPIDSVGIGYVDDASQDSHPSQSVQKPRMCANILASSGKGRHSYFRARKMQRVCEFA